MSAKEEALNVEDAAAEESDATAVSKAKVAASGSGGVVAGESKTHALGLLSGIQLNY